MKITEKHYNQHCEKYKDLGKNLKTSLGILLKENDISFLDVFYRIKDYESFKEKIKRKGYDDPFNQNEDFCGLRIICYFPNDIEKIAEMIKKEFIIHSSEDKSDKEIDRFGYRSYHFIVSVNEDWLSAPNFRGLNNLKVEIQVRTILMHAWADIEHKLQYKKKEHIPQNIQRKFYQLSALFELADEQFEQVRNQKELTYLSSKTSDKADFDVDQEMNVDTLQAFLDLYFDEEEKSPTYTRDLLDELFEYDIDFSYLKKLVSAYSQEELNEIEEVIYDGPVDSGLAQVGFIRVLLDINHSEYAEDRIDGYNPEELEFFERIKRF